ncbi:MAG: thiamine phosphate synthase [Burkholderiaceae bacterium]|jgi:thiamine-phosphate pyrophosphorylase
MNKPRVQGVYAITPTGWPLIALLDNVEAALEGGVRWLQYRQKETGTAEDRVTTASALARLCADHAAHLLINDDIALAKPLGTALAGCHLGRDDSPLTEARALLGKGAVLGASCYDRLDMARLAVEHGADYLAFGAVFASPTKPGAVRAPLSLFEEARPLGVPLVAIGGIGIDNIAQVVAAGADAVAVVTGLFGERPDAVATLRRARALVGAFAATPLKL